jgi:hypothetical protein
MNFIDGTEPIPPKRALLSRGQFFQIDALGPFL